MANNEQKQVIRLTCAVQNYDWGKPGNESSTVANLYAKNSITKIDTDKPYAELWMGTHDSGPSYIDVSQQLTLKDWIMKNPDFALGQKVVDKWGSDLPFLFKVLSVAKALSIQAHPDKELAKTLHKLQPNAYKDANHKPEMALAITEFEALCGFIPPAELINVLHDVPEIVELVGTADATKKVKCFLQSIFTELMTASKEMTTKAISSLKNRLNLESQVRQLTEKEELVLRLEKQYPADIGVISAFFFNYVKLNPGEALYIGANEPHAYLSGECIECMATSDNVVRAGLTPKYRDVDTLCSMLTYEQDFPEILKGFTIKESPYITKYQPPFDEFEVDSAILPQGASVEFPAVEGPSIYLVTAGEGVLYAGSTKEIVSEGDVLFAVADVEIVIVATSKMQLYRAGVNSWFFAKLAMEEKRNRN
ncbi:hypothetical protein ACFE04_010452 [Oxalis oulophora]